MLQCVSSTKPWRLPFHCAAFNKGVDWFGIRNNRMAENGSLRWRGSKLRGDLRTYQHATAYDETATISEDATDTYNWFKQWWPCYVANDLHTDRPNRIQLLGEYYVVWKSAKGEWIVMKDICPHRLAPLSEGRIETDGTIMCSYHGWRFNDCGKCVKIPQADDAKSHEAACNSQRSVAKTYPCKVAADILWVWPDDSETAVEDSAAAPFPMPESFVAAIERQGKNREFGGAKSRILPYSATTFVENILDPSHVPFSHHSIMGMRDDAVPLNARLERPLFPGSILRFSRQKYERAQPMELLNPCSILDFSGSFTYGGQGRAVFFHATPLDQYSCLVFIQSISSGVFYRKRDPPPQPLSERMFPWLRHIRWHPALDGDNVFLHEQDKLMSKLEDWTPSMFFTPTTADVAVNFYRKWLSTNGKGVKSLSNKPPPTLSRQQMLDRYDSHVVHCKTCQEGLRLLERTVSVCEFLGRGALLVALFLMTRAVQGTLPMWRVSLPLVPYLIFAFIAKRIKEKLIPKFYFIDYVHQEKN